MNSVWYRLGNDVGLKRLAGGLNGMFDYIVGFDGDGDGREICAPGRQRCRVVLRLRIETVVPVMLTVSVAVSCLRVRRGDSAVYLCSELTDRYFSSIVKRRFLMVSCFVLRQLVMGKSGSVCW